MPESPSSQPRHRIFVLSGPGGVGKTTVSDALCASRSDIEKVMTATTRAPRKGEVDGEDYLFLSEDEFEAGVEEGAFVEHVKVYGRNWYGTPRSEVERILAQGKKPLLVIDVKGGCMVKQHYPDTALIFLMPPSEEELRRRLNERGFDGAQAIEDRLAAAAQETATSQKLYDYHIINEDLEGAVAAVSKLLQ